MTRARAGGALVALAAVVLAVAAVDTALRSPGFAMAGGSPTRLVVGVGAGLVLVAASLAVVALASPSSARAFAVAGCIWLAAGMGTPGARLALEFTIGLLFVAAAPAVTADALLVACGEGVRTLQERALRRVLYASLFAVLGLLPTLFFDPAHTGCAACPRNLLLVADSPSAVAAFSRWGIGLGFVAIAWTVALVLWRLARSTRARRSRLAPLIVPGCAYLVAADAGLAHAWHLGFVGADRVAQKLWTAQAATLIAVAAGLMWLLASAHRRRATLARIVVELAGAQQPGGLRGALAKLLDEPDLDLLFAVDDVWIDATGHKRSPPTNMATTYLFREHKPVAVLCHRPGVLDDPRLGPEIERSVRLGLENERLRAELRRRLVHLRRSRADVAAAGEAERRRLERDLHDGAQQRLVACSFALGMGCRRARAEHAAALALAQREVREALAELRELAHGLYPVALAEAGLAAAIESLSDRRPGLRTAGCGAERFAPAVEETAYLAIASLAEHWSPEPIGVIVDHQDQRLIIDLRTAAGPPADTLSIEDRVRALGGSLAIEDRSSGHTHVRVELPCA